jgi:hypothetical protein
MQTPTLWKRVLNESVQAINGDEIQQDIVVAPVIMCGIEVPFQEQLDPREFTGLAIPFPEFWIEGYQAADGCYWGNLVIATDCGDEWEVQFCAVVAHAGKAPKYIGSLNTTISKTGQLGGKLGFHAPAAEAKVSEDIEALQRGLLTTSVARALAGLMLLGCNNVSLSDRPMQRTEARRAAKRHGGDQGHYRFHVLVVRPPGRKGEAKGEGVEIGTMPFHVARGHYQHYGPANVHHHRDGRDRGLLFGKYAGRFFVPPTVRGNEKNGIVDKSYAVNAANGSNGASVSTAPTTTETPSAPESQPAA